MKRKKTVLSLLCIAILLCMMPMRVKADTGPKPSVTVSIKGLENEIYYATLLSESPSTGPASAYDGSYARYAVGDEDYEIWEKFVAYTDNDGFYFLQEFWECSGSNEFCWGYYPPSPFKILLYFPEYDSFIVSDIYERYAFDSYYNVDLSGVDIRTAAAVSDVMVEKSYDYTLELVSLAIRIVITILIELAVALLFGFREKKQLQVLAVVNIVTQIVLNVLLNLINYNKGYYAFVFYYVVLEIVVFTIEAFVYAALLCRVSSKDTSKRTTTIYALVANVVSFICGLWLAQLIPGIF